MAPRTSIRRARWQPLSFAHRSVLLTPHSLLPAWVLRLLAAAVGMASLGKLVLIAGLAFLVLAAAEGHVKHGPAAEAEAAADLFITAATPAPEVISPPAQAFYAEAFQKPPVPPSGPSDQFNSEVNIVKPSSGSIDGQSLVDEAP